MGRESRKSWRRNAGITEKQRHNGDVTQENNELRFVPSTTNKHGPFSTMTLQAAWCYDWILDNLAMIGARRLGVSSEVVFAHSDTLWLMKYTVKAVYGTSARHYSSTATEPLAGTPGQGSGESPALWLSIGALQYCCWPTNACTKGNHILWPNRNYLIHAIHWCNCRQHKY